MKTSDFYYDLPKELIAQTPMEPRDHSRLLCLDRQNGMVCHRKFYDLADLLEPGDTLVVNDSRVLPARLYGAKDGSDARIEFLLLEQKEQDVWEVLCRPGKKVRIGTTVHFNGLLDATVLDIVEGGNRLVKFTYQGNFYALLEQIGQMPLPPYITEQLKDQERYQTVYAHEIGSAAAPTAGLHFTPELLQKLEQKGVNLVKLTLHVGLGTFRPVKVDDVTKHKMHAEHYELSKEAVDQILATKQNGKRVIAVGTTSCRTLEAVSTAYGKLVPAEGYTDIFIYPGYEFKVLDGLITNFHLPESTLIMLVCAFAGYDHIMEAYRIAVEQRYRFFSFGDAMLIV